MKVRAIVWTVVFGASIGVCNGIDLKFRYKDNPQQDFASRGWLAHCSLFQRNIRAAGEQWKKVLATNSNETIIVLVEANRSLNRVAATFSNGKNVGTHSGLTVYEPGSLSQIGGGNPGRKSDGYDILVSIVPKDVDNYLWLDPTPHDQSDAVPQGRDDFQSIIVHELGHGFGFSGARKIVGGARYGLPNGYLTTYDRLVSFGGNGAPLDHTGKPNPAFFKGRRAQRELGRPVPLTHFPPGHADASQNFYHLGQPNSSQIVKDSLMSQYCPA